MPTVEAALQRLRHAPWLHAAETQRVLALLGGAEGRTRAVGGIVRDTLLGLDRGKTDIDFATELTPDAVMRRAAKAGIAVHPTGLEHGTVTLHSGALVVEVTTLREDVDTDGRHATVAFGTDWAVDAARRDFTLNALYVGMDGTLFDPLSGLDDCLARRVRFIGDARARIAEDRLRVYRFFRFSASHAQQSFDADGVAACAEAAGTLGRLAAERVGTEMRKMLSLPRIGKTLAAMAEAGIGDLSPLGIARVSAHEAGLDHPPFAARLALLAETGALDPLEARWRLSKAESRRASAILAAAALIGEVALNEAAYRYAEVVDDALGVARVRFGWGAAAEAALRARLAAIQPQGLPLAGRDFLAAGLAAGPAVGDALKRAERLWIDSGFTLSREALLSAALQPD